MPYVPTFKEISRLRAAIDRASLSEFERIFWLLAFAGLVFLDGILLAGRVHWVGIVGTLGGFALLYWRLRGGYMADIDRELHGIGLRTEAQRAFTALMLRQAFTGRNALRAKPEHDPIALWNQRIERSEAPAEEA
ncbi:MAG: hypothetical protein WD826_06485 [Actinomycetota bacterium]